MTGRIVMTTMSMKTTVSSTTVMLTRTMDHYIIRIMLLLLLIENNPRNLLMASEIQGPDASSSSFVNSPQWRRQTESSEAASVEEVAVPTTPSPEIIDLKVTSTLSAGKSSPASKSTPEERNFPRMAVVVEMETMDDSEASSPTHRSHSKRESMEEEEDNTSNINNNKLNMVSSKIQATFLERFISLQNMLQELNKMTDRQEKSSESEEEEEELTVEQKEAELIYENAMTMLSTASSDKVVAYSMLQDAAARKHSRARAELAWAHTLGHFLSFNLTFAVKEFDELAREGIPEAHMGLAYLHALGVGGKNVSQSLVLLHLTFASMGESNFGQIALGYRYLFGINVPPSCEKALSFYQRVARRVKAKVKYTPGPFVHRLRLIDEAENPSSQEAEIIDYYQLLADKGDVQSQVGLGQLYYQGGKVVQQDHKKAFDYFTLAANSGNAVGYAFLGKLYLEGSKYIKADNATALKYFAKAATMGDPVGQSGLGLMYLKGLGVPKDPVKALNYFTMAADQGWVEGQLQLGNMYFLGEGVKPDYILALKYFTLASQSGHVLAYYNLGVMHSNGLGILRSCPTAVEFFKHVAERDRWSSMLMTAYSDYKAGRFNEAFMQYAFMAELGMEVAQSNAAYLLENHPGVMVFQDRQEELIRAFYYWKRAAAQDYSAAQVKLGDYYYYGLGTDVDFETAAALYRKASDQQYNAQAMFNLGYMHEKGLGMKKDWHLAKRLYDLAAKTSADAKIPVTLALIKLQFLAKLESLRESPYRFIFFLDENIAANWDLYLTTILTLLLGITAYLRRSYERQMEQLQTEIDNLETFLQQINMTTGNEEVNGNGNAPESGGGDSTEAITSDPSREHLVSTNRGSSSSSATNSLNTTNSSNNITTSSSTSVTSATSSSSSSSTSVTGTTTGTTSSSSEMDSGSHSGSSTSSKAVEDASSSSSSVSNTRLRNIAKTLDRAAIASTADPTE